MKYFLSLPLLMICMAANSQEIEKIDIETKWYGSIYSIGEKETGFWAMNKEGKQVIAAIKTNPQANKHLKNAYLFNYASMFVLAAYIVNSVASHPEKDEKVDSFDLEPFLIFGFVEIGLAYGQHRSFKKAVEAYNSGVAPKISVGKKSSIGFTYRF